MSDSATVLKDRYELESELGRGGMSVVYLARDRQLLSKRVVVKVLLEDMSGDPWIRKKFLQEMEALSRIDHPGVVGALDTGETPDGKQFLVMQYVEGVTLRQAFEPGGMSFPRAAALIRQIGGALAAAHDKGVWHRDLKPENIMLQTLGDGQEHVKLIDFGIAGIKDSAFGGEKTNVAGSLSYMAPEQYAGKATAASDIYALGVVAYEMLTGTKPFSPDSLMHLVSSDQAQVKSPRELRADLPEAAAQSIRKAISFEPEARQASVRAFSEELAQALTGATSGVTTRRQAALGSLDMAHVLFVDLVGYSLLPMDQQKDYLAQLQRIVRESPRFRGAEIDGDILCLPTGDGMALSFFGDPTAPVQCALEIAAALKSRPHLKLRMGIHTGPVYRVADVNASANLAGGGINVAQRVMNCGDAGHILVSKSVADVLLQLSRWAPYLTDLGEHSVKHGVRLNVFNLSTAELGNPARPSKLGGVKKRRLAPLWAAALVLLLVAAAGAWYLFLSRGGDLRLNYSITVQKFRDGKEYGNPFRLPGEMVFEQDYGIALDVESLQHGFLYVLNEGPLGATGARSIALLEPRNAASAERAPAAAIRIPPARWFQFDAASGTETCYLVWSGKPVPELESVKALPADKMGVVLVEQPGAVQRLHEFLAQQANRKVDLIRNEQARQTELRTRAQVLVHPIRLEHQ